MEGNQNKGLNIILAGGLNQIYTSVSHKFTKYDDIIKLFYKTNLEIFINFDLSKFLKFTIEYGEEYSKNNFNLFKFNESFYQKFKDNFGLDFENLFSKFAEVIKKDIYFVENNIIEDIISQGHKIIIIFDNPIHAMIEYKLTESILYSNLLTFKLKNDEEFINQISLLPKLFIFFDHDLQNLKSFSSLGCWTVYLTHYTFTSLFSLKGENPLKNLLINNINVLKQSGKFFNFSVEIFHQLRKYFNFIQGVNKHIISIKSDNTILQDKINILNPVKVLTFYKIFFKKGELKKAFHYTSNEKVLFQSHIGGVSDDINQEYGDVNLDLNGKFEVIILKLSENQEVKNFSNFIAHVESYSKNNSNCFILNSFKNLKNVLTRDSMIDILNKFCAEKFVDKINEKYNSRVIVPSCFSVDLMTVYEVENFKKFINEKNLKLPVIIKYTGPNVEFNHLLINIITEEGIINYVNFMKQFALGNEDKVSMIIQSYINHGGYVLKLYRANNEAYIYTRPSLPDVSEELTHLYDEYKNGFFKIATSDLLSEEYTRFWNKLSNNEQIVKSIDKQYLTEISETFEKYSEMSLFGLDFLYDIKNKDYYLVDVNVFPGYKELVNEFNEIIISHVLKYHEIFKNKKNIFN